MANRRQTTWLYSPTTCVGLLFYILALTAPQLFVCFICRMALDGSLLLYDSFLSLFGNTGLTPLDEAGGRTSSTGTPSANVEDSTPTVRRRPSDQTEALEKTARTVITAPCSALASNVVLAVITVFRHLAGNWNAGWWFAKAEVLAAESWGWWLFLVGVKGLSWSVCVSVCLPCSQ